MCRVFGCVASEPASIRHGLIEAVNPLIRQSEDHDSGWGMAVYEHADGLDPRCVRFPEAAFADDDFLDATDIKGRIFNVHVRRVTMGGLAPENTHPFCLGSYSFGHNGTILRYPRLLEHPSVTRPSGDTDSEAFFNFLMTIYDAGNPIASLRKAIRTVFGDAPVQRCVRHKERNVLDHLPERDRPAVKQRLRRAWAHDDHARALDQLRQLASERVTDEDWHTVQQDVLLVLDPDDLDAPHAERLLGDELLAEARVQKVDMQAHLRGDARGEAAAERARAAVADS